MVSSGCRRRVPSLLLLVVVLVAGPLAGGEGPPPWDMGSPNNRHALFFPFPDLDLKVHQILPHPSKSWSSYSARPDSFHFCILRLELFSSAYLRSSAPTSSSLVREPLVLHRRCALCGAGCHGSARGLTAAPRVGRGGRFGGCGLHDHVPQIRAAVLSDFNRNVQFEKFKDTSSDGVCTSTWILVRWLLSLLLREEGETCVTIPGRIGSCQLVQLSFLALLERLCPLPSSALPIVQTHARTLESRFDGGWLPQFESGVAPYKSTTQLSTSDAMSGSFARGIAGDSSIGSRRRGLWTLSLRFAVLLGRNRPPSVRAPAVGNCGFVFLVFRLDLCLALSMLCLMQNLKRHCNVGFIPSNLVLLP